MKKYGSKIFIIFVLIYISIFSAGVYAASENIIYSYGDGNGNVYIMSGTNQKTLEYKPVKPKESSSGTYDGGKYVKKNITNLQYNLVAAKINEAVKNKKIHIKDRIKMSGMITIKKKGIESTYIIKPDSKERANIEKSLKEILGKNS